MVGTRPGTNDIELKNTDEVAGNAEKPTTIAKYVELVAPTLFAPHHHMPTFWNDAEVPLAIVNEPGIFPIKFL